MRGFLQRSLRTTLQIVAVRVRMCPVAQQRKFCMIARRIIQNQAESLETICRDVIIPIRIAVVHKEVLIHVEILSDVELEYK